MKTLLLVFAALTYASAAAASSCGDKIADLEARSQKSPPAADSMSLESTDAKLHHQPTAGSVGDASASADSPATRRSAHFQILIEQALAADHSGDIAECEASVREAQKTLEP